MIKKKHVAAIFYFEENVSQLLTDVTTFYTALGKAPGNTHVTIAANTLTTAQGNVTKALAAEAAVKTRTAGTADARNTILATVITDVRSFVLLVQAAANLAPDEVTATQVVTECGLTTRAQAVRVKKDFEVVNDDTQAGVLDITFKAAGQGLAATYEVQESADGTTFTTIKTTPGSRSTYTHGKAPGTRMFYRGRIVLSEKNGGEQVWITAPAIYVL
jgi:hypothetical protein